MGQSKISDYWVGQMVLARDGGETGWVRSVDVDSNTVYVEFTTGKGTDLIDMDPADLEPVAPKR